MYLPFYLDHWAYGPAHSSLDSPDLAHYFLLVRMTALHMLAQCEQCTRCAGPRGISICAHGDISTVTIGIYAVNT